MHNSLALLILLLMALSACWWYAVANRSHSKKLARYHNSRVPEGELAAPTYDIHHHVGSRALVWTIGLTMLGILMYIGVPGAVYKAIVEHQGYFASSSMPSVPTFGHSKPYVQKADATRAHAPTQATHRPKHAKHKPDPIVELIKRNQ